MSFKWNFCPFDELGLNLRLRPTERQITAAYRKLSKKWHPDKNGNTKEATAKVRRRLKIKLQKTGAEIEGRSVKESTSVN
jgi:preprotein translocase subunit Sec63